MVNKDIDTIFRNKFAEADKLPDSLNWDKDSAIRKLRRKKIKPLVFKLSASVAALLIVMFSVKYFVFDINENQIRTEISIDNEYEEYRKRLKLYEMEMRMSGKKVYKNYCINCEGDIPKNTHVNRNPDIYQLYN
jgi:hypothetical protein